MSSINTSIEINKPIQEVSDYFYDFTNHENWDPFMKHIKNITAEQDSRTTNQPGDILDVIVIPKEGETYQFNATIIESTSTLLSWKGYLLSEYIFSGIHKFEFKSIDNNKTILNQSEDFSGLLVSVVLYFMGENTKAGFTKLNEALKKQLESSP
ncbi:hypothetical protein DFJ63DRAFT_30820 [Scheffersomyces coipomensis]|uniref:uncharacterized protein n=1 Tax=Scheffersomyces coipomensis TaxID=1788519 RepID=UPI00315D283F